MDKHSPDRKVQIIWIGKDKCEHKAYPHEVCLNRKRIQLRVNEALVATMFLSDIH